MKRIGAALYAFIALSAIADDDAGIEASFRGCDASGWCRFWFEVPGDTGPALHAVLPEGVTAGAGQQALRDRLNALLADMIHQSKRIALHGLRGLADGGLTARITVTGVPLADDEQLRQLKANSAPR